MPNLNRQKINRFYVASDNITRPIANGTNDNWSKPTLEEAIKHAERILQNDSSKQMVAVVEITHIVTRQDLPVKVLKLKR